MTIDQLNVIIRRAPHYGFDNYTLSWRDKTILAIKDFLDSLEVGSRLNSGSLNSIRYDPWHLEKIGHDKWTGFHYDYGINALDMAEFIFQNCKSTGFGIDRED